MSKKIGSLYYEITGDTSKLKTSLSESKVAMQGMNKGAADAISSMTGLNLAGLGAGVAIAGIATAARKAVTETVAYADAVRDMAKITGNSVEETSRLIQVADDLVISEEELGTALQGGVRKGIDVSIDGLSKLSDEYLKLEPGLERSKFLMDTFGRSGSSMAMFMEQGADGIRKMSASIDDSLVLTDEAINSAREYEKAMDDLGDSVQGVSYDIGTFLAKNLAKAANAFTLLANWSQKVGDIHSDLEGKVVKTSTSYREYANAVLDAYVRTGEMGTAQRDLIMQDIEAGTYNDVLREKFGLRSEAAYNVARSSEYLDKWDRAAKDATVQLAKAQEELKSNFELVNDYISGDVTETYNKFNEKNNELWGKTDELSKKIGELEGKSWLTEEQKEELGNLKTELGNTKLAIEENEKAYKKETNEFILSTALKYMALDDLSQKDLEVYTAMAENMGLLDQPTKDLIDGIGKIATKIDTSKASVKEFADALSGIPDEDVNINVRYNYYGEVDTRRAKELLGGYASGADFTVPPGNSGDSFGMNVSSGEHVKVTQAGVPDDTQRLLRMLPAQIGRAVRDGVIMGMQK